MKLLCKIYINKYVYVAESLNVLFAVILRSVAMANKRKFVCLK